MTPKQKYDERKRLRTERLLREEQRAKDARDRDDDMEERMTRLLVAFERIADVMELWADSQDLEGGVMDVRAPDIRGSSIDAAYLNALRLGPQRIGRASVGCAGIPLPVARRLAATGRAVVVGDEVRP